MKGFSLVESVLAMVIIGAGFVGVVMAIPGMARTSLLADQSIVATNLAAEALEKVMARRDCNAAGCGYASTIAAIAANGYNANPVSGFTGYVLTVTVLEVNPDADTGTDDFLDANVGSGYARVTAQVNFNNNANTIKLATMITNY
ncbi:MAG: type II secretion system protein [Myxococcota bacterium]